jgi:hypothetical protein
MRAPAHPASLVPLALLLAAWAAPLRVDRDGIDPLTLHCANSSSGAAWEVAVDQRDATAVSYPATISDRTIAWRDARRGNFNAFDRVSGELAVTYASSTGGVILRDFCRVERRAGIAGADAPAR